MLLFLYLLLGHVIGDFVLQSSEIVRLKRDTTLGLYPHIALVTIATAATVWGSTPAAWLVIALVGAIHVPVDRLSVLAFARTSMRGVFIFVLDQVIHVATLVAISWAVTTYVGPAGRSLLVPFDPWIVAVACGVLAVAFAGSIFVFQVTEAAASTTRRGTPILGYTPERIVGMIERATLYLSVLFGLYAVAGLVVAGRVGWVVAQPNGKRREAIAQLVAMLAVVVLIAAATVAVRPQLAPH